MIDDDVFYHMMVIDFLIAFVFVDHDSVSDPDFDPVTFDGNPVIVTSDVDHNFGIYFYVVDRNSLNEIDLTFYDHAIDYASVSVFDLFPSLYLALFPFPFPFPVPFVFSSLFSFLLCSFL